ncbi:hypothetical protein L873DRAFT_1796493 [Choiromyces venosus 120613-1]|uniref:Uncharacterized protein n=1 Tax=Choiromyces venosus 120613-1 TaxID=1336337 RepID=A0A3N4ISG4_9PEZI|nr:hypothetical protein L873DRAFT_1796493 [Choiromyces venosus 120613-1]
MAVPACHDPLSSDLSGLRGLSTGSLFHPYAPTLTQPTAGSASFPTNIPSLTTQQQPPASKRRCIESASSPSGIPERYFFNLRDDWADNSPMSTALFEQGFYKSSDVPMFASSGCPAAIINELSVYPCSMNGPQDEGHLHNYLHSLVQQELLQKPHVYLTVLAAMRTTNRPLVSLPVPLIKSPGSSQSKFMDPTFALAKFIEGKDEVPAIPILYSLDASFCIRTSLPGKKGVKGWWDKYNTDLTMAGTCLPNQ